MNKKVAIHLATGFEEVEAINTIDVLRRAGIEVLIVSITSGVIVTGAHNIAVTADCDFKDVDYEQIDMIILPGGMPGSKNLDAHEGLKKQIKQFYDAGKKLSAICAAPLVFGKLGLLKGEKAVCYPGFESNLKGATIVDEMVVESGIFITAKGPGAALLFGLKIVEQLVGKEKAKQIGSAMFAI